MRYKNKFFLKIIKIICPYCGLIDAETIINKFNFTSGFFCRECDAMREKANIYELKISA